MFWMFWKKIAIFEETTKLLNKNIKLSEEMEKLLDRRIELLWEAREILEKTIETIENLELEIQPSKWDNNLSPCEFCGWKVVYMWDDAHWIADIKCVGCWAKWFVNLMFR